MVTVNGRLPERPNRKARAGRTALTAAKDALIIAEAALASIARICGLPQTAAAHTRIRPALTPALRKWRPGSVMSSSKPVDYPSEVPPSQPLHSVRTVPFLKLHCALRLRRT